MTETDLELATRVGQAAGQLLIELRKSYGDFDPSDTVTRKKLRDEADRTSNNLIIAALKEARPDDAILSEESVDIEDRDSADRVWIVDPLDGTSEYGQGRTDFAVHIALWERAVLDTHPEGLTVGVVDLPAQGLTRTTGDMPELPDIPTDRPVRIVVSRSRPPKFVGSQLDEFAFGLEQRGLSNLGVEVVNVGSVGAKVCELLAGRSEAYLHDTGFYEWDAAAPLAVAQHYGLVTTHMDGSPVQFNKRPPWVADFTVCLPQLEPLLFK